MSSDRQLSVNEMKRILKQNGRAYISLGASPPFGFVDKQEWQEIMGQFKIEQGGSYKEKWALLSLE
jgi:hypothetical protein